MLIGMEVRGAPELFHALDDGIESDALRFFGNVKSFSMQLI
jgi:hypothetical protein